MLGRLLPLLICGVIGFSSSVRAASDMQTLAASLNDADFSSQVERLVRNQRSAQALELADIGLKRNPKNVQLMFMRANLLQQLGRGEEARSALQRMIRDYPEIPEPYNNLAVIEAGLGNLETAESLLTKALVINADFGLARKNLADVYLSLALENYRRAEKALPGNKAVARRIETLERLSGERAQ